MSEHIDTCDCGCGCGHDHDHGHRDNRTQEIVKIVLAAVLFVAGYVLNEFTQAPEFAYLLCFGISYLLVGFDIVRDAVESIMHGNVFNENFLMTVASLGAFAIKEYSEGCAVMLLFSVGELLQSAAVAKSKKSITDMLEKKPETVSVVVDGKEQLCSPEEIKVGDIIIVKPGEKIYLDGIVQEGTAEVDMKDLTGESIPATKGVGDTVLGGSISIDAPLTIRVTKPYSQSTVARIMNMLEYQEGKRSGAEKFITRFAKIYTPVVCLIALLIVVVPPLFFHGQWNEWLHRGLSALVVSCPCAIVISVPLCFFSGIGSCSGYGMLVKGSNYLEMLSKCDTAVFDKTGTVTSGKFEYVRCECHHCHCKDKKDHHELLRIIAACEKYSTHPIAKSVNLAFGAFADDAVVTEAKNYPGMGVSAIVDGTKYYVGNAKMMEQAGVDYHETEIIGTAIYCCNDTEFLGDIVFADIIREDSRESIEAMRKLGIKKTVMLTGDKEEIAKDVSSRAGIDHYYSKLLPDEKAEIINTEMADGHTVLYVGDGINDVPVITVADVGIAMGGAGSDVAIEAADIVVMGDSLSTLPVGMSIAKKTMRLAKENIVFSIAVKLVILVLDVILATKLPMWVAVFGDVGVCLLAVANSLRAMIVHKKK